MQVDRLLRPPGSQETHLGEQSGTDLVRASYWHLPKPREASTVLPSAFALSWMVVLALPGGKPRAQLSHLSRARDAAANLTVNTVLPAQSIRVAVYYAILSGLVTALVPPDLERWNVGNPFLSPQLLHLTMLAVVAVGAAAYGTHSVSSIGRKAVELAFKVGARGIFLAGLIAVCVALPYQLARPMEMGRITEMQVLFILFVRLAALPLSAGLCAWLWIGLTKPHSTSRS